MILTRTSIARDIVVKQTDECVMFLGRHDSGPMRRVYVLEVLRGTERETDGRNQQADDEQDGSPTFLNWLTRWQTPAKVSMSTQAWQQAGV